MVAHSDRGYDPYLHYTLTTYESAHVYTHVANNCSAMLALHIATLVTVCVVGKLEKMMYGWQKSSGIR